MVKSATGGYDGRGVHMVDDPSGLEAAIVEATSGNPYPSSASASVWAAGDSDELEWRGHLTLIAAATPAIDAATASPADAVAVTTRADRVRSR